MYILVNARGYTAKFILKRTLKMKKKKRRFRLEEKNQRLDVRLTTSLRDRLEAYCTRRSKRLTEVITIALEDYLDSQDKASDARSH